MSASSDLQFRFSISGQPAGYAFGMTQPSVPMNVLLRLPTGFARQDAMTELVEGFQMSEDDCPALESRSPALPPVLAEFLACACGLARHLLQEGGIPVFCPEVVLFVEPPADDPGAYRIVLSVAVAEFLNRDRLVLAYSHAFGFMGLFNGADRDAQTIKARADSFHDSLIMPLRSVMKHGLTTKPMFKEAHDRGIPVTHLGGGMFQLGTGSASRLVLKSATDKDGMIGARMSQQKYHTQAVLQRVGAPVADTVPVLDQEAAVQAAQTLGFPVVVKPADLDRSEGVFVDLETEEDVRVAYDAVHKLSSKVLVQRRIPGVCHRLVTFQGRFVFAYTRHPAGVEGDGEQTVRALVEQFNTRQDRLARHLQKKPIPFDDIAHACLAEQGLSPDHVLGKGEVAFLRVANVPDYAGYNEIVTDKVHPANVALAERLSKLVRLESVGVDLISTDVEKPWYETGAAITELNFQPQIGENTARANLEAMFPSDQPATVPVACFVGGAAAMQAAQAHRAALAADGTCAMLTSHDVTLDGAGHTYHLTGLAGLFERAAALLQDPDLDHLVVVVQTDELIRSGPPFAGRVTVTHVDDKIALVTSQQSTATSRVVARLIDVLKGG